MLETLGSSIPALPHAISVSLPTWRDNVDYEEGAKRVIDAMLTGYPRFFIHKTIQKLAEISESKFGQIDERCLLFPSSTVANECRSFMLRRGDPDQFKFGTVRVVQLSVRPEHQEGGGAMYEDCRAVYIVLFPAASYPLAKQFWQHTGLGISSRYAERCLAFLESNTVMPAKADKPGRCSKHATGGGKHYGRKHSMLISEFDHHHGDDHEAFDHTYVEERYGRNLPLGHGAIAKRSLRRRIAGVLVHDPSDSLQDHSSFATNTEETGPSFRGVQQLTEEDVYLFPTGMSAIWSAHQLAIRIMPPQAKSVCFGFPYTDTLKILQKWGSGCHHYGHGTVDDLQKFRELLSSSPPNSISCLFCEFPSNPLLRSAPLKELRKLANEYDFLLVVDDTIGNFVNVEVLPYADMVVSGLTKVFSGDANVMGGSMVLNPELPHYQELHQLLQSNYEDVFYSEDAIFLERNSRDFVTRVKKIDENTNAVTQYLYGEMQRSSSVIKRIWYPRYETTEFYDECRVRAAPRREQGGYGGLFSITFHTQAASQAFFDALKCSKGPSLGTNFTLACPYTILAHYTELEWAREWGVDSALVRISIGLEKEKALLDMFETALLAAQSTSLPTSEVRSLEETPIV